MSIIKHVRDLQSSLGMPEEMAIPRAMYDQLVAEISPNLRFMRSGTTENVLFPLFSNCIVRPGDERTQ